MRIEYFLKIVSLLLKGSIELLSWSERENIIYINLRSGVSLDYVLNIFKRSSVLQATQLLDLWAVDLLSVKNRFVVNYLLVSLRFGFRLILKVSVSPSTSLISIASVYPSANWLEREVWDMYGIFFKGHPDLRRILTDYGFDGFPLRKDFPLTGYTEVRYDEVQKKVVQEPLEITQEFRYFDYSSPWEKI